MSRRLDPAILPLAEALDRRAVEGLLYTKLTGKRCPSCGATVIARRGFRVERRAQDALGRCVACNTSIAGYWGA